jgi:hypothetical protein
MFFKLTMPAVDRLMKGGVVGKWHKAEGEHVNYGDDLVDVKVELTMSAIDASLEQRIRLIEDSGAMRDKNLACATVAKAIVLIARLTSSDVGVLRRIETKEGIYGEVGSLLAILSTEDHGATVPLAEDLREACELRVVANLVG